MSTLNAGTLNIASTLNLPSYTVAERDALTPQVGTMIFNNEDGGVQVWDGTEWKTTIGTGGGLSATGGIINTSSMNGYTIHAFTSNNPDTFAVQAAPDGTTIDVLVVGGGGGGGGGANATWHGGGGGGAGQVRLITNLPIQTGDSFAVSIGNGGGGGAGGSSSASNGNPGASTTFGNYTAIGGGAGKGALAGSAGAGGSGGGDSPGGTVGGGIATRSVSISANIGDYQLGHRGGRYRTTGGAGGDPYGAGGGGAGSGGHGVSRAYAGSGGHGLDLRNIFGIGFGDSGIFAGGGGGGGADDNSNYNSNNSTTGFKPAGGPGGGGDGGGGGNNNGSDGSNGDPNTGGGGGGGYGGTPQFAGGQGGSGIVLVRYITDPGTFTAPLGDPRNPADSAVAIKTARPTAPDGIYWINTAFNGPTPFWCDMTTDGGGWILVYKSGNYGAQGCSNGNYFEFPRNSNNGSNLPPLSVLGDAEFNDTSSYYRHYGLAPANRGSLWSTTGATNYAMSGHSADNVYDDRSTNTGSGTYKTVFFVKGNTGNSNWNNGSNIWAFFCGGTQFSNPPGNGFPNQSLGNLAIGIGAASVTTQGSAYEISSLGNYGCNCCEGYYTNTSWGGVQWFGDGYGVNNASAAFAQTTNFWIK